MRSKWKIPFFNSSNLNVIKLKKKNSDEKSLFFKSRSFTITPFLVGFTVKIPNGSKSIIIEIKDHHVGYKIGNFTITKKRCVFKKKK